MQVNPANANNTFVNTNLGDRSQKAPSGDMPVVKEKAPQHLKSTPLDRSIVESIEKANKIPLADHYEIHFSVHKQTQEIMVKIMDMDTHKVVKEIPPEKILDLIGKIMEMAGIIVDEKR